MVELTDKIKGDPLAMSMWIAARNPRLFHKLCRKCQRQYNKYIELSKGASKEEIADIGKQAMTQKFVFCARCNAILKQVKI